MKIRSTGETVFQVLNYVFLAVLALITIYPFLYTFSMSLSSAAESMRRGIHIIPLEISMVSYNAIFRNEDILIGFKNSAFRTIVGTGITLLMTSAAAYPLSRKYMPNRRIYSFLIIFTMLFNGGIVPNYLLMKNLHLIDNYAVYILPVMISAFSVIVVKNFFQSIPDSLQESAKIDGANEFTILFKIFLPLSAPVLATVALWTAVGHWNAWLDAVLYMNNNKKIVLQVILQRIINENSISSIEKGMVNPDKMMFTPETLKSATIMVTMLPILAVYPFVQRYFVKGIMVGSVKG